MLRRTLTWLVVICVVAQPTRAATITLKSGLQLQGRLGKIGSLNENPLDAVAGGGQVDIKSIVLLDNDLTRIFVPTKQIQNVAESDQDILEVIRIDQPTAIKGKRIGAVGPFSRVTGFDEYGRRIVTMRTAQGPIHVLQGITEITPVYTKLEGLSCKRPFIWDMRVATSSIPAEVLTKVISRREGADTAEERLKVVRLYIQAERMKDARAELESVLKDFPQLNDLKRQFKTLHQVNARRLLNEIELRREAGQHKLCHSMLQNYPREGVAGVTLLQVQDILNEYQKLFDQGEQAVALLSDHVKALEENGLKTRAEEIQKEIELELNVYTINRLADFLRLADDKDLTAAQKVALAISGWLLGSGSGTENMAVASSLYDAREAVIEYLRTTRHNERAPIVERLRQIEGASPENIAKMILHMKPPVPTESQEGSVPGFHALTTPGLTGGADIEYLVQLPPEYHPYRRYPCIVTLNGAGTTPEHQIDWWSGTHSDRLGMRMGQASRRGFVVIAPRWTTEHQRKYGYTAREHAAVLHSLRDACRRFSIDTDRVFLTGHSMGGDAVWDIGLAHPDLWAGVIPIVATADKYVSRYSENGRGLPFYFVGGEMDGSRLAQNGRDLDRYLTRAHYDVMVVQYQGRGHEDFHDEIQRMFEWMNLYRRNFFPRELECVSMRPWDNYFWWVELNDIPDRSIVVPAAWPSKGVRPATVEGRILENNRVSVRSTSGSTTVWLSPDMVDFRERVTVVVNGRGDRSGVTPDIAVLLEDVRSRADRQHPFWAKFESDSGR